MISVEQIAGSGTAAFAVAHALLPPPGAVVPKLAAYLRSNRIVVVFISAMFNVGHLAGWNDGKASQVSSPV
jgi:hypothetical protein